MRRQIQLGLVGLGLCSAWQSTNSSELSHGLAFRIGAANGHFRVRFSLLRRRRVNGSGSLGQPQAQPEFPQDGVEGADGRITLVLLDLLQGLGRHLAHGSKGFLVETSYLKSQPANSGAQGFGPRRVLRGNVVDDLPTLFTGILFHRSPAHCFRHYDADYLAIQAITGILIPIDPSLEL